LPSRHKQLVRDVEPGSIYLHQIDAATYADWSTSGNPAARAAASGFQTPSRFRLGGTPPP